MRAPGCIDTRLVTRAMLPALLAAPSAAQSPIYSLHGSGPGAIFGFSHAGVGDVDGDGFADFIIGAPRDNRGPSASGSATLFSGRDGTALRTLHGDRPDDLFGYTTAGAGDVDGDGVPDVVVAAPRDVGRSGRGYVRVFSGSDCRVLFTFWSAADHELFGFALRTAGDVDGDGRPDLLVGAPQVGGLSTRPGYVRLYSGADGSIVHEWNGSAVGDAFGFSVSGAGDVDGDRVPDVIVGAPSAVLTGRVQVFSGATGAVVHRLDGRAIQEFFGSAVCPAGDVDRDGVPDFAVGAYGDPTNGAFAGAARVFAGADARQLRVFYGDSSCDNFGVSVRAAGDLDGDGSEDLVAGTHVCHHTGYARALSGADGTVLFTVTGRPLDHFGLAVSPAGDVDADGHDDVIVSAHTDYATGYSSGSGHVFSGRVLPLSTDDHLLSLSVGGTVTMSLDAGPGAAGTTYLVLGSATGISPGIRLGAVTLPLVPDGYLAQTLSFPGMPPLLGSWGTLDGSGRANAAFTLPTSSPPALAGLRLDHAYVLYAGGITFASNAVPLTFVQ